MIDNALTAYYRTQQISPQWVDFLRVLAGELASQAPVEDLRNMMFATGQRQAATLTDLLGDIQSLARLQENLNLYWQQLHWGFVQFEEAMDHVTIKHCASPLLEAFGESALPWSVGFLEGFYDQIFKVLGAAFTMRVSAMDSELDGLNLYFRFSQP